MTAELLKLRCLPTPRWTLAAVLATFVITLVIAAIVGPGDGGTALLLGVGLPTQVASIVIGAWMAGVEYGQGTKARIPQASSSTRASPRCGDSSTGPTT